MSGVDSIKPVAIRISLENGKSVAEEVREIADRVEVLSKTKSLLESGVSFPALFQVGERPETIPGTIYVASKVCQDLRRNGKDTWQSPEFGEIGVIGDSKLVDSPKYDEVVRLSYALSRHWISKAVDHVISKGKSRQRYTSFVRRDNELLLFDTFGTYGLPKEVVYFTGAPVLGKYRYEIVTQNTVAIVNAIPHPFPVGIEEIAENLSEARGWYDEGAIFGILFPPIEQEEPVAVLTKEKQVFLGVDNGLFPKARLDIEAAYSIDHPEILKRARQKGPLFPDFINSAVEFLISGYKIEEIGARISSLKPFISSLALFMCMFLSLR